MPWLLAGLTVLSLSGCGGGSSSAGGTDAARTVQAAGTVVDDQGIPLAAATVTVVSVSAASGTSQAVQTDGNGRFALTLDAATPAVLRVDKAGYTRGFKAATTAADNATAADRVVLLPVASTQTFDPAQAAVLRVPGSAARVELTASSLVRQDGQPISGSATVSLTPIDPSADVARMPGLLVDGASGTPIESLGALSVSFTDASGAALNLASGQSATIRIPATPAAGASGPLPATFPLYHLNETTGRWTREGTATLRTDTATGALYYEGTVSHFSFWNADQVLTRSLVDTGTTVGGATCSLPAGLRVLAQGLDYNGQSWPSGNTLFVRQNSQVRVTLLDTNGAVLDALNVASGAAGATTRVSRCLSAPPLVTLSGRVHVTSGLLADHRVQISGDAVQTITLPIGSDGTYATRVYANRGAVRARLVGADRGTPDALVTTTVAALDASFPDLTVQDTRFDLSGCVQGWADYRQSSVQVGLFRGATQLGAPKTLEAAGPNFVFTGLPLHSTLTLRLTAPDATLSEKTTTLVVGSTPVTLGSCLALPRAAEAAFTATGTGLARSFDASGSTAGDAAIQSYRWDFGDGQSAVGVNASHTYAAAGGYAVVLTVTDALGQQSTVSQTVVATTGGGTTTAGRFIASGGFHTCSLNGVGGVLCFGYDGYGQLGGGDLFSDPQPVAVVGLASGVSEVAAGGNFSCARTDAGAIRCWGENDSGQLGGGGTQTYSASPQAVSGLASGARAVSAGASHACALNAAGGVVCWGRNDFGQLGDGSTTSSRVPVAVSGLASGVVAIAAGQHGSCAVTAGAGVFCWGRAGSASGSSVPVALTALGNDVVQIALGMDHGCALTTVGGVRCWGSSGQGQLGNGSTSGADSGPVGVTGLGSGMVEISAGPDFSCALSSAGQTYCWGRNDRGQLGDGSTTSTATPVLSSEQGGSALGVSARGFATCVLRSDRSTQCWGWPESYAPGG